MPDFVPHGMGWLPDLPDPRDISPRGVEDLFAQAGANTKRKASLPTQADLRSNGRGEDEANFFTAVFDQQGLNSSAALACVALLQYFQRRSKGQIRELSGLFLYKIALRLRDFRGDNGVDLRTTLKAMVKFGVPPEKTWPYEPRRFDENPTDPWLYSYAKEIQAAKYVRLDQRKSTGAETLHAVKSFLAAGLPVVFGFAVPTSISQFPDIPYRPRSDAIRGGQAVVAVGYDNQRTRATKGALLIRNSWGESWGDGGYGWLPYAYVEEGLASCFWTLIHPEWLESGEFYCPVDKTLKREATRKQPPRDESNGAIAN